MAYRPFRIAKSKIKGVGKVEEKINKDDWIEIVENDPDLTWVDDSNHRRQLFKENKTLKRILYAYYEFDEKKDYGNVLLKFSEEMGFIMIDQTKTTLSRLEKYFEIANKLDALLLQGNTKVIDEKYVESYKKEKKA